MPEFGLNAWPMIVLVIGISLVAGCVRGITGFGGPAIMLLVLTQFFHPVSVLSLVVIADYSANLQLVAGSFRQIRWRSIAPLMVSSVLAVPVGIYLLGTLDAATIKRSIAVVVGICAVVMLAGWRYRREAPALVSSAVGLFGGFVVGLTYIALPVMIFIFGGPLPAAVARANALVWGCANSSVIIVILAYRGVIGLTELSGALVVTLSYMSGAWLGARWFKRFSEQVFRRIVLWLLIALSVVVVTT